MFFFLIENLPTESGDLNHQTFSQVNAMKKLKLRIDGDCKYHYIISVTT